MDDIRAEKEHLRASIKERLKKLSPEDRARESRSLCKRLMQELPAETTGTLCVFYPMTGSEADIRPIFPELLERGWKIFFPRFEQDGFAFRNAATIESLVPGRYGLMEPSQDEDKLRIEDVDLAILPGLAFDASGNRLGRGNGGYDKWLKELRKKNPRAQVWGTALECQMVRKVPAESHDERVDKVCTHRGFMEIPPHASDPR